MLSGLSHRWCTLLLGATAAGLLPGLARVARAQSPLPPEAGGRTVSLGQPPLWHWLAGVGAGALYGTTTDLVVRGEVGAYHAPLNPVTGLAEVGMEAYVGARGSTPDGGVRALLQVPYLSAAAGADYNLRDGRVNFLVTFHTPMRRGGLLTRGSLLRLDWYPLQRHGFTLGVTVPLGDPLAGRSRPIRDYVDVSRGLHAPAPHHVADPALEAALDSLRVSAEWIRRLVVPFLDQDGRDNSVALARTTSYLAELRAHLAVRSVEDEVRFFHAQLERVFTLAAGGRPEAGGDLARRCRQALLDDILLPYDRLLGRKKRHDTLNGLSVTARAHFSRGIAASDTTPAGQRDAVLYTFQRITEILEAERRRAASEWDDPRLAWLPLQYALLPEDHDEQVELDALLERATGVSFTEHNRLAYVANLQFHWELLRTIHETRSYHVLWIHDFPASTEGKLDSVSFRVVEGYLTALTDGVKAYDSTGTLPSFFIFLDQHYYEERSSRVLMNVLEDPLRAPSHVSLFTEAEADSLARALARLRVAVDNSRVLRAEWREYGNAWLHNRIKVHVNITNRPDPTFWGGGLVGTVFGYPDAVMRDHRKIAFRDVTEDDPYGGEAIVTGMGAGEEYLGPGWDDRSLVMEGPALLQLRAGAHDLLLSQGLTEEEIPIPLRPRPARSSSPAPTPPASDRARYDARAMALINGTGYLPKPLNVAKALLYSLMPPGSVFKIPDSLWNATFYASLLVGACLRGGHVLIIAPALANAPGAGFPPMARAHELFSRLLLVQGELGAAIGAAGGELHAGLYAMPRDERGFAGRAALWASQVDMTPFLRALLPSTPALLPIVADAGRSSRSADACAHAPSAETSKLHQKTQFLATREFWRAISASPEWPAFMATYLRYRESTYCAEEEPSGARALPDSLERLAERVRAQVGAAPGAASFAIVGSQNQDYRGMFMDGEIGVLFTGSESLVPLIDLVFMAGTVTWVTDQRTLDMLLPPPSEFQRRIGRNAKDLL